MRFRCKLQSKILVIFFLTCWYLPEFVFSQDEESDRFYSDTLSVQIDLFSEEGPMDIALKFDIKSYQRDKFHSEYLPVQLTYQINDSTEINKKVRIKARGNLRKEYCSLPPFWLNIKKAKVGNKYLEGINKIKIVTHCMGFKTNEQYVIKECLAYKIFNEISPYSFRVRLIRMKYIDTGRKNKETNSWAFMIEPEEMMTERLGAVPIKSDVMSQRFTDTLTTDVVAMFQYMIGNADYSVAGRHNLKLIRRKDPDNPLVVPVPYDFDYSGLVNASYAIPGDNLGLTSVTQRYYLGPCRDDHHYINAIDQIYKNKKVILELVESSPYLDRKYKKEMMQYLGEFFSAAEEQEPLLKAIRKTCR